MPLANVKPGQHVWVHWENMFIGGDCRNNLDEEIVTQVNTRSFYTVRLDEMKKDPDDRHERRFDRRKMVSSDGFGDDYSVYLDQKTYWDLVKKRDRFIEMKNKVLHAIKFGSYNFDTLNKIYNFVNHNVSDDNE